LVFKDFFQTLFLALCFMFTIFYSMRLLRILFSFRFLIGPIRILSILNFFPVFLLGGQKLILMSWNFYFVKSVRVLLLFWILFVYFHRIIIIRWIKNFLALILLGFQEIFFYYISVSFISFGFLTSLGFFLESCLGIIETLGVLIKFNFFLFLSLVLILI